jgi:hypothetical protein
LTSPWIDQARFMIVTPTIGRLSLIRACRSVDHQTFGDWQHLVAFDGEQWPIGLREQLAHPRRQFLTSGARHHDFGHSASRLAEEHAVGDFIVQLDDEMSEVDPIV